MQPRTNPTSSSARESRLLLGMATGIGCLIVACLVAVLIAFGLALIWTLQGQLGPGGQSMLIQQGRALLPLVPLA